MEQHKQNIARLLESGLENAPLAYNLSVAADLKDWFLSHFLSRPKIKAFYRFCGRYEYQDQVILFEILKVDTCHEKLTAMYPDIMVTDLSELAGNLYKYRSVVEMFVIAKYGEGIIYSENLEKIIGNELEAFFAPIIKQKKLAKTQPNFPSGGIMSDHIDFIGQNAPTGEFVIAKNMLKVQKRLSHASR